VSLHLSDDQLLDRLYGVGADGGSHLDSCPPCPQCQARWNEIQQRRAQAAVVAQPPAELFRRQRRQIQNRLVSPPAGSRFVWAPAAVAVLLLAGIAITETARKNPVSVPVAETASEIMEAGWFEDAYSATRELEPWAAAPLRELFEVETVVE
jgi:hypothetical protein